MYIINKKIGMTPSMLDEAQSIIVSPFIVTCNYQSNLMPHKYIG